MDDVTVEVVRLTVDTNNRPAVGPFVHRTRDRVFVGFTFGWKRYGFLGRLDNALRQRCMLPESWDANVGAELCLTIDEARIMLRGLQEAVGPVEAGE